MNYQAPTGNRVERVMGFCDEEQYQDFLPEEL